MGRESIRKKVEDEVDFIKRWTMSCFRRMLENIQKATGIKPEKAQSLEWLRHIVQNRLAGEIRSIRSALAQNNMDLYNETIQGIDMDTVLAQISIEEFIEEYGRVLIRQLALKSVPVDKPDSGKKDPPGGDKGGFGSFGASVSSFAVK